MNEYVFDWSELAFGSKKGLKELRATFIAAPRELSAKRLIQLVRQYLPKGNIVLGISKEPYVLGLEDQPQFQMLTLKSVSGIIEKVWKSSEKHKVYVLEYNQRDLPFIIEKISFTRAVFVNGSWYHTFHTRAEFYAVVRAGMSYELVSPFTDEAEAEAYLERIALPPLSTGGLFDESAMFELVAQAAKRSYDYAGLQVASVLARKKGKKYVALSVAHNEVVPYETYAMHVGGARERHFSPPQDLNHYDTVHAEMLLLVQAQKQHIDMKATTLFIGLLPCPTCARVLSQTDIGEIVYQEDHSAGYAVQLFEKTGKRVHRFVGINNLG